MSWEYTLPEPDSQMQQEAWRLMRALDLERTEDLALHLWNLGHLHTRWYNWPPKDWSSIPRDRPPREAVEDRETYTFDFLGPFKVKYTQKDFGKTINPIVDENTEYVPMDVPLNTNLEDELNICYERLINKAISKHNGYSRTVHEVKSENVVQDDIIDTSDSEEVPYEEELETIHEPDVEYRRKVADDISMPEEQLKEVMQEVNNVIDELIDSRLRMGTLNKDKIEPFDWRNVVQAAIDVSKTSKAGDHYDAKEAILKLFSHKMSRPPMPERDPYFDLCEDPLQAEDAEMALWRDNLHHLKKNEGFELELKRQMDLQHSEPRSPSSSVPFEEEPAVPILSFSKAIVDHFKVQEANLAAREKWRSKFNKVDEMAKACFSKVLTDSSNRAKQTIRYERSKMLKMYDKGIIVTRNDPKRHINPKLYNLKNYKKYRPTIINHQPSNHRLVGQEQPENLTKPVKIKLKIKRPN